MGDIDVGAPWVHNDIVTIGSLGTLYPHMGVGKVFSSMQAPSDLVASYSLLSSFTVAELCPALAKTQVPFQGELFFCTDFAAILRIIFSYHGSLVFVITPFVISKV